MSSPVARMTAGDIAELANVHRATVSNWQHHHRDTFPQPLPDSPPGRPQFDATAVKAWLANRYPDKQEDADLAVQTVRDWRYLVNQAVHESPTDPYLLLIGAVEGKKLRFRETSDERYPITIDMDGVDAAMRVTRTQAEAIRDFLDTKAPAVDPARLIEATAQDIDGLSRYGGSRYLYRLLSGLVHEESQTVLDPNCGTGAFLAVAAEQLPQARMLGITELRTDYLVAQARSSHSANIEIEKGDLLERDVLDGRVFDTIVAIPPFGRQISDATRERLWRMPLPFGPLRGRSVDGVWLQIAVQALAPGGKAFLVLPHSIATTEQHDDIRRGLIQHGLLAAIVALPTPTAFPSYSTNFMCDLWVLSRRRDITNNILFVDYSEADLTEAEDASSLRHALTQWLDDPSAEPSLAEDGDVRFTVIEPIKILGSTVNLDPLYWNTRASAPSSAAEFIAAVTESSTALHRLRDAVLAAEVPECPLLPGQLSMSTVHDARNEGQLDIVRRAALRTTSGDDADIPVLGIRDAEAIARGELVGEDTGATNSTGAKDDDLHLVCPGDVLVWASKDRQIRATVCTVGGRAPSPSLAVLRCNPEELDPHYLALALSAGTNTVHLAGSAIPRVRAADLSFGLMPVSQQRELAHGAQSAQHLLAAAEALAAATTAFRQALSDAVGSGLVGIASQESE